MKLEAESNTKPFFLALSIFYLKPLCFEDYWDLLHAFGQAFPKEKKCYKKMGWGSRKLSKAVDKPKGLFGLWKNMVEILMKSR